MVSDALEHLDGADDGEGVVAHARVALDDGVLQAQLDRVEPELPGELVEERLDRERRGRRAWAAVGAEGEAVRLHAVAAEIERLPAVRAGDEHRGDVLDAPARVRAAVDDHARLDRGERPVLAAADAELRDLCGRRVRRLEVLAARERQPDRPAQRERCAGDERLDERELAAERAAERLRDDAHLVEREAECAVKLLLRHERALRARRDDERPVRLEPGGRGLRLEVRLVHPWRPERGRDDGVASVEDGVYVSVVPADGGEDVGRELLLVHRSRRVDAGVDRREVSSALFLGEAGERCARPHGCLEVDHGRERVVVHDDGFGAVLAVASDSATTIATGCPANTTSSRASGSVVRS